MVLVVKRKLSIIYPQKLNGNCRTSIIGPYGYDIGSEPVSRKSFHGFNEKFSIEKLIKFKNHLLCISGES